MPKKHISLLLGAATHMSHRAAQIVRQTPAHIMADILTHLHPLPLTRNLDQSVRMNQGLYAHPRSMKLFPNHLATALRFHYQHRAIHPDPLAIKGVPCINHEGHAQCQQLQSGKRQDERHTI